MSCICNCTCCLNCVGRLIKTLEARTDGSVLVEAVRIGMGCSLKVIRTACASFGLIVPANDLHTLGMTLPSNLGSMSSLPKVRAIFGDFVCHVYSCVLSLFISSLGVRFPNVIPSGFTWDGKKFLISDL